MLPWWERFPTRLKTELAALDDAGIAHKRNENAFHRGLLCLDLTVPPELVGEVVQLEVAFPDLYPYFRPEVSAPTWDLRHHQNPLGKNLCLLARPTESWDSNWTAAELIVSQLPLVVRAAAGAADVAPEVPQAEPVTEYYPYFYPASVLLDGALKLLPKEVDSGFLSLRYELRRTSHGEPILRALIDDVYTNDHRILASNDGAVKGLYSTTGTARWVRLEAPPRISDVAELFQIARDQDPYREGNLPWKTPGGELQIWGLVFPSEIGHRREGHGWLFPYKFDSIPQSSSQPSQVKQGTVRQKKRKKRSR
ncbi:MAG: E2/UBC family protein [Phycisphaeraceae bacterium]